MEAIPKNPKEFAQQVADKSGVDGLLNLARVAEAAERYQDMCIFMQKLVLLACQNGKKLSVDQRNLLSVAYKNVVGSKRASWRDMSSKLIDGSVKDDAEGKAMLEKYKAQVEKELNTICTEVIGLLGPDLKNSNTEEYKTDSLLKNLANLKASAGSDYQEYETEVFYLKMVGDYCRYLAEIDGDTYKEFTSVYYKKAYDLAKDGEGKLPETHPTRLGLALNYSVCYYEILKKPKMACDLAKAAFDGAIEKLDTLNDNSYKDSTLIMQLLRDNLTLWTSETSADAPEETANP